MADEDLSLAQRLRIIADSIELAERHGFWDNELRTDTARMLQRLAVEVQQPVIDEAIDKIIAERPISRRERKALHRLRAKLALVDKPQDSTTD